MNKGHSVLPSGSFLEIDTSVFSGTQHGGVVCDKAGFFRRKNMFEPKMGKIVQKYGFLNLLENLVINFF